MRVSASWSARTRRAHRRVAEAARTVAERNIEKALLKLLEYMDVTDISVFYRTKPLENRIQGYYLNGVWRIGTSLPPRDFKFSVLRKIESELHRERTGDSYAARTIDLNILLYDSLVIDEQDLAVPDPAITTRPFIAFPLMELDPGLIVPGQGISITEITGSMTKDSMKPEMKFTDRLRRILTR